MNRFVGAWYILVVYICLLGGTALSQDPPERWSVGLHEGGNLWLSDFGTKKIGPGIELSIRHRLTDHFSLGVIQSYEEMKTQRPPSFADLKYYYTKLHSINALLTGWFYPLPERDFSPYLYGGVGTIYYRQLNEMGVNLNDAFQGSPLIRIGAGLQKRIAENASLTFDVGLSMANDKLDRIRHGLPDSYATAKIGVNFSFGGGKRAGRELTSEYDLGPAKMLKDTVIVVRQDTVVSVRMDTVVVLERQRKLTLEGINFAFNSARLTHESIKTLEKAFILLVVNPNAQVEIIGHTDNIGSQEYNERLSLRRAQSVKNWLVKKGIASERLTATGAGSREAIASNGTPAGRAKNRRIEFRLR